MQKHITESGCNVFVHLAPIEVGNATKIDGKSSTLQKGKQARESNVPAGRWVIVQGNFRRRAHIVSFIRVHVGVGQRCRAEDVYIESPAKLPTMSTRNVPAALNLWVQFEQLTLATLL